MDWFRDSPEQDQVPLTELLLDAFDPDDPLDTMTAASELAAFAEEHKENPRRHPDSPDIDAVVETLAQARTQEADLMLILWDLFLDPSPLTEFQRRLITRRTKAPAWVASLNQAKPTRAVHIGPVTGELRLIGIEIQGPDGPITAAVDIFYSGIAMIRDGYVYPGSVSNLVRRAQSWEDEGITVEDLALEDARAEIEDAIEWTERYIDAPETETWPSTKPLLRWMLRLLPDGGTGYEYPEYTEEELDAEIAAFMASPHAANLGKDAAGQAGFLLNLADNYGSGDVRNWSSQLVERVLLDLIPRKLIAADEHFKPIPKVLEALVVYCHEQLEIPSFITDEVLHTIAVSTPEYRRLTKPSYYDPGIAGYSLYGYSWGKDIGGAEAIDSVNTNPLPVEKFDSKGLSREVGKRARSVAQVIEESATEFFGDPELTTATLRLLRILCDEHPQYFTYKSTAKAMAATPWEANVAASLCWLIGKSNNWFRQSDPSRTVKALMKAFGVKTPPNGRGDTIAKWIPTAQMSYGGWQLGNPSLLTSTRREEILSQAARDLR